MELKRMSSTICPTPPEQTFLKLVRLNSIASIKSAAEKEPNLLKHEYPHPDYKTILQIACSGDTVSGLKTETLDVLLELGADRYASTEINKTQAWHYAAASCRPDLLKILLKNFDPTKINSTSNGNTALHCVIKNVKSAEGALECVNLLLDQDGIDVNRTDNKNHTPILIAAEKGYKDIVECLITKSCGKIDLDSHKNRNKQSARDIIRAKNLYSWKLPDPYVAPVRNRKDQLDDCLKNKQESEFIACLEEENDASKRKELCNENNGSETYLQYCCEHDLQNIAEFLLKNGADPNGISNNKKELAITIAARQGNYDICVFLLMHEKTIIPEDLLSVTIISLPRARKKEAVHKRYIDLLFEKVDSFQTDPYNHQDWKRRTPLHYACRYGNQALILELLNRGASLACKNDFGQLAVTDISATTLRKHLDNCIEIPKNESALEPFVTVTYNYKNLVLPSKKFTATVHAHETTTAIGIDNNQDNNVETLIPYKSEVVAASLFPEMDVILYMTRSCELKELLKHPVITSFLYLKWYRLQLFFYVNLLFYLMFCASLIAYILIYYSNSEEQPVLKIFIAILFFGLIVRELFQLIVAPKTYVKSVENWLEVSLILVTGVILGIQKPHEHACRQLSSVGILLAAIELILLIGQHPRMAENVTMLRTVSKNFFVFLVWYSILIIAFAFSFYTLFKPVPNAEIAEDNGNEEKETDFFVDPLMSVFKTIIMLTGEFDAGSLNFVTYPLTSRIIFILFVFMIAIVLFNLLNGLAVSDTQTIRNDAQLVAQIARARQIAYYERVLMGDILPRNLINFVKRLFDCVPDNQNNSIFVRCNYFARRICLFPEFLPQYRLTVRLSNDDCYVIDPTLEKENRVGFVKSANKGKRFWRISLDKYTADETHVWLHNKKEQDNNDAVINQLLHMVGDMKNYIQSEEFVSNIVDAINNKDQSYSDAQ